MTLHGWRVLGEAGWIGYFGLGPSLAQFLGTCGVPLVDLDAELDSQRRPAGFTVRAAELAVSAARACGHAAVAVSGHPAFANPFTSVAAALARAAGLLVQVVTAPSAIDDYATRVGDVVTPGTVLLDARDLATTGYMLDDRLALALWNGAYLGGEARLRLGSRLVSTWGPTSDVVLFRAGAQQRRSPPELVRRALNSLDWWPLVDAETLLLIPARTSNRQTFT